MKLLDCAAIRTGLVLARKEAKGEFGTYPVKYKQLNLKCIQTNGLIDTTLLEDFETNERLGHKYLTQSDDIVIRLSYPYTAVLINEENRGLVIPSHFAVIRVISDKLLPRYLLWLLSREKTKNALTKNTTGFFIGTIRASLLGELDIAEIPLEKQMRIANFYELAQREVLLLQKLAEQKEILNTQLLSNQYKESKRGYHS